VRMLHKSMSTRSRPGRGDIPGLARLNLHLPMLSIDTIHAEMHICFEECGYVRGQYPFSDGGWEEEGIPSRMVIKFCERQTESLRPTACTIFHQGTKFTSMLHLTPSTKSFSQLRVRMPSSTRSASKQSDSSPSGVRLRTPCTRAPMYARPSNRSTGIPLQSGPPTRKRSNPTRVISGRVYDASACGVAHTPR